MISHAHQRILAPENYGKRSRKTAV